MAKKSQAKSPASEVAMQDPDQVLDDLQEIVTRLDDDLRDCSRQVDEAAALLKKREAARAFVAKKLLAVRQAFAGQAIKAVLDEQPHDASLRVAFGKAKGLAALKQSGAEDAQILEALRNTWPPYNFKAIDEISIRGGELTGVWFDPNPGWTDKADLKGAELVAEARRLLGIEKKTPKPAAARPVAKKVVQANAGKPKPKPSVLAQSSSPAAKIVHSLHPPKQKKPAGVGKREQTYGQWLAALRGNIPAESIDLGNDHDRRLPDLVKLYEAKQLPSVSKQVLFAMGWFDKWIVEEEYPEDRFELALDCGSVPLLENLADGLKDDGFHQPAVVKRLQKKALKRCNAMQQWEALGARIGIEFRGHDKGAKKVPNDALPANVGTPASTLTKIIPGQTFAAATIGLEPEDLTEALSPGLHQLEPVTPYFTPTIGTPVDLAGKKFVVVNSTERANDTVYTLHPIVPSTDWKTNVVSYFKLRKEHKNKLPLAMPLFGLEVETLRHGVFIMGNDSDRFSVTVPKGGD